jgi:DNA gyrase/topoisomerase IV subunit A
MKQYLLVITEDGYGKRVAVDDIRYTKSRNRAGVKISSVRVAFAEVVDGAKAELVLATARGKIQRLDVGDIPIRRRMTADRTHHYPPKGVRIMKLDPDDRIASAAVVTAPESTL